MIGTLRCFASEVLLTEQAVSGPGMFERQRLRLGSGYSQTLDYPAGSRSSGPHSLANETSWHRSRILDGDERGLTPYPGFLIYPVLRAASTAACSVCMPVNINIWSIPRACVVNNVAVGRPSDR